MWATDLSIRMRQAANIGVTPMKSAAGHTYQMPGVTAQAQV
jgi:hypothetical protein